MANHAYVKTNQTLNPDEVENHIRQIVNDKLKGLFEVEKTNYLSDENAWYIHFSTPVKDPTVTRDKETELGLICWISNEEEYSNIEGDNEPKIIREKSVIEFRHGHTFQFMWWVEGVIRENLGAIYNARIEDDGLDPSLDSTVPKPEKYETFKIYCTPLTGGKKGLKQSKKWWLGYQKPFIPNELLIGLDLDFEI